MNNERSKRYKANTKKERAGEAVVRGVPRIHEWPSNGTVHTVNAIRKQRAQSVGWAQKVIA